MPAARNHDRNQTVDLIRTAALIGICVVNLPYLGLTIEESFSRPEALPDQIAAFLVQTLFEAKFFLLFSFLFGWGFAIQMQSAAKAEASFPARYFRRLAGLAVFGCLHAIFVLSGDILLLYAVLGLFLWPLRRTEPRRLIRLALLMLPLSLASLAAVGLLMDMGTLQPAANTLGGGFVEATRVRLADWLPTLGFLLLFQGPLAFAAFLCGLAAARSGFFDPESAGRTWLARAFPWLFGLGLILNAAAALASTTDGLLAFAALISVAFSAPMLAAAWLQLLLLAGDRIRLPNFLVRAGQNSLSAYILQGLIAGFVFGSYGLGCFGLLGQAALLALAPVIALTAMTVVSVLAEPTGRAPFETILRGVTYGLGSKA